jgi:ABC-type Fe3+ transport system permease subunit
MRFILRFIGLWLLAGAFVALIIDGTGSIAAGSFQVHTFGQTWDNIHQDSKPVAKAFVDRHAPKWVWDSGVQAVLDRPTWLVLGVAGAILVLLGRKKKPPIGYGRD